MIDPRDVIAGASIAEHCRRAEAYFQLVEEPERLLEKPFVSLNETPLLLYRLGLLLAGLEIGPTMRVLDFGAGTCWVAHILACLHCHVTCVDASATALALGRRMFDERPAPAGVDAPRFLTFDGETLPVASGSFDRIICFDALHHVPNPGRILAEFHRVLKDGGRAGFSEPGRLHSRSPVSQYEMQHYGVIENDIRLEDIKALADEAGFTGMLAAAESGFETWLTFEEARMTWESHVLPERWVTANVHSFHGRSTFVLQKGVYRRDSRLATGLAGTLRVAQDVFEVRAGEALVVDVEAHNTGSAVWLAANTPDIGVVKVGAKLRPAAEPDAAPVVHRTPLPGDLEPGAAVTVPVSIVFDEPGEYEVTLDLLDERIVWFETLGLVPPRLHVTVLPRPAGTVSANSLSLPYECRFARLSPSRIAGFGDPEPFGRWTIAEQAFVELPAPVSGPIVVVLACQAFGPNVGRELVVRAGGEARTVPLTAAHEQQYTVSFDGVDGATRLELVVPAPASPRELGVGDDDRRLGIALSTVSIRQQDAR